MIALPGRMGYGRRASSERTSASGDAGVDGIISQDPLGLDRIYVQAKRYAEDRAIDRPRIHEAERINARIELIVGRRLAELLVTFGVGVQAEETVTFCRLDEDYFESL